MILGGAWLVLTARIWALGETHYLRDFWTNYLPARVLLRGAFREGRWPLWNPWIGGGLPAAPDPASSLFYFPGWPLLLFEDQAWALSLLVALHLAVAALGMWALARRSMGAFPATAAAAVFAFGGLLVSNQINAQFQYAYCLVPAWWWVLLGALDAREARLRGAFALALAAVWGLQLLAPDPQTAYLEGLAALVAVLATQWGERAGLAGLRGRIVLVALAALAAAVLAAPQLAAFLEALGQTNRQSLSDAEATTWSLSHARAWELVLPLPFGRLAPVSKFWASSLVGKTWSNFYFASLYAGALAVPLGLLGVAQLGRRARMLAAGAIALVALALGTTLPLYTIARHVLPLWSAFRYPERLVVLPLAGLAFVVGLGVERLATGGFTGRWAKAILVVPAVLATLAWACPQALGAGAVASSAVTDSVVPAICQTLGVVAVAALLLALVKAPGLRAAGLAALVTSDLLFAASGAQATWSPPPPTPRPVSTPARVLMPLRDLGDATARLPSQPAVRRVFEDALARPNINATRSQRTTNAVTSLALKRAELVRRALGTEGAAALYETEFLIAREGLHLKTFSALDTLAGGLTIYRAATVPTAVLCTARWQPVATLDEGAAVLVRGDVPVESTEQPPTGETGLAIPCTLSRPVAGSLAVRLESAARPLLVSVSESFYPGWQVRFDGGAWRKALATRVAFVGAIAPPKTSLVEFRFRPAWFTPTLALGALAWSVLLAAAACWRKA